MTKKQQTTAMPPERGRLTLPREEVRRKVRQRLDAGQELLAMEVNTVEQLKRLRDTAQTWREVTTQLLHALCTSDDLSSKFVGMSIGFGYADSPAQQLENERDDIRGEIRRLESISEQLDLIDEMPSVIAPPAQQPGTIERLGQIAKRFHVVARQLRRRQRNRQPFEINDEYDVQDLLHALLRLHFEDVRQEEATPSLAGGSARMDFVLKLEDTVVEVKMTRAGLGDRELGQQLIQDAAQYKGHPNCKTLFFFIYDPDGHVRNPAGLERDIAASAPAGFAVHVLIEPK